MIPNHDPEQSPTGEPYVIYVTTGKMWPSDPGFWIYGPCPTREDAEEAARANGLYAYRVVPLRSLTPNDEARAILAQIPGYRDGERIIAAGVGVEE